MQHFSTYWTHVHYCIVILYYTIVCVICNGDVGGDLVDRQRIRTENDAAAVVKAIVDGIRYCHDHHIAVSNCKTSLHCKYYQQCICKSLPKQRVWLRLLCLDCTAAHWHVGSRGVCACFRVVHCCSDWYHMYAMHCCSDWCYAVCNALLRVCATAAPWFETGEYSVWA
jgi:hypothetical protein